MCKKEELFSQLKIALEWMEQKKFEQSRKLLSELSDEVSEKEEYRELLGEWHLLMGRLNVFEPDLAISHLQKARELIPEKSVIVPQGLGIPMEIYGPLFTFLRKPGTAEEVGQKLEQMMDLHDSLCGETSRYDLIFYAQLAYYRGEFEKAKELFIRLDRNAMRTGNLLDKLCVAEYRTRIAFHQRDTREWNQAFSVICGMQNHEDRVVREVAACMKSQIRMSIGLLSDVPRWLQQGKFGAISEGRYYRMVEDRVSHNVFPIAWITHMEYLLGVGDFYRVINGADIAASLYGLDWMLLYDCYLKLYKASAWNALGNSERTEDFLKKAAEILAPDGLWLFGAEFFPTLGDHPLKEIEPYGEEIVEKYRKFSDEYRNKLTLMRKMLTESVFSEQLTEKEQEVARLAALGYKNDEIGDQLYISRNTVKYHLANVYKKLGISNRVELKAAMDAQKESEYAYWTGLYKKD